MSTTTPPRALLTDVFGTVVDWRGTVTKHLTHSAEEALNSPSASIPSTVRTAAAQLSWPAFAQLWRESYYHFTRTYNPETTAFKSVDQHHLEALIKLLRQHDLEGLWNEDQLKEISMIWHFLDPWLDSSPGLGTLNQKFVTSTLSNGNTALLSDLAKHGSLPYAHLLSAEDFKAYKPHPNVYLGAAKRLNLEPGQCALVAAHLDDLAAARKCGYQTIYIDRPREEQWSEEKIQESRQWVDMWIEQGEGGFEEAARRFGIKAALEKKADKGVYHEGGSITGAGLDT
jgi:2-haloacid dehalogenase